MTDDEIAARMILIPGKNGSVTGFYLGKAPREMFSSELSYRFYNCRTGRRYRWSRFTIYDIRIDNRRHRVELLVALAQQISGPSLARAHRIMQ